MGHFALVLRLVLTSEDCIEAAVPVRYRAGAGGATGSVFWFSLALGIEVPYPTLVG